MRYRGLLRWHDHQTPLAIVALGPVPDVCDEGGTGGGTLTSMTAKRWPAEMSRDAPLLVLISDGSPRSRQPCPRMVAPQRLTTMVRAPRSSVLGETSRRPMVSRGGNACRNGQKRRLSMATVDGAAANEFAVRRAICVPLRRLPAASRSPLFPQRKRENGAIRGHEGLVSGESTAANPHSGGLSEPVFGRARSTGPLLLSLSPSRDSPKYGYESASRAVGVGRAPCRGIRTHDGCDPIAIFKPAAILGCPALQACMLHDVDGSACDSGTATCPKARISRAFAR